MGDASRLAALSLRFRSSRTGSTLRSGSRSALPSARLAHRLRDGEATRAARILACACALVLEAPSQPPGCALQPEPVSSARKHGPGHDPSHGHGHGHRQGHEPSHGHGHEPSPGHGHEPSPGHGHEPSPGHGHGYGSQTRVVLRCAAEQAALDQAAARSLVAAKALREPDRSVLPVREDRKRRSNAGRRQDPRCHLRSADAIGGRASCCARLLPTVSWRQPVLARTASARSRLVAPRACLPAGATGSRRHSADGQ